MSEKSFDDYSLLHMTAVYCQGREGSVNFEDANFDRQTGLHALFGCHFEELQHEL